MDGVTGMSFQPADVEGLTSAVREVLDDPAAAQTRAKAARDRLTSDFDWQQVAQDTAQVYLSAKRRVRHPLARPDIPQRPLPDR